jgi:hypothetical protein
MHLAAQQAGWSTSIGYARGFGSSLVLKVRTFLLMVKSLLQKNEREAVYDRQRSLGPCS